MAARPENPAAMWTTVPPAKSRAPTREPPSQPTAALPASAVPSHQFMAQTQWASGQ
jgi:hypothetical protein